MKKTTWRYCHFTHVYHKWQPFDVWFLRYQARRTEFFVTLNHFFHFYLPKNSKNQNFEELKKTPGDITIWHKCTKNHDHMLYCSWNRVCDRLTVIFHFGLFFTFLPPQQPKKSKFWKNEKSTWRHHPYIIVYQNSWSYADVFLSLSENKTQTKYY